MCESLALLRKMCEDIKCEEFLRQPYSVQAWEGWLKPRDELDSWGAIEKKDPRLYKKIFFGTDFHDSVFYEIKPMVILARSICPETCQMQFLGTQQKAEDGILFHPSLPQARQGVQCVVAMNGLAESIRMEAVRKHGHAPAFGDVRRVEAGDESEPAPGSIHCSKNKHNKHIVVSKETTGA